MAHPRLLDHNGLHDSCHEAAHYAHLKAAAGALAAAHQKDEAEGEAAEEEAQEEAADELAEGAVTRLPLGQVVLPVALLHVPGVVLAQLLVVTFLLVGCLASRGGSSGSYGPLVLGLHGPLDGRLVQRVADATLQVALVLPHATEHFKMLLTLALEVLGVAHANQLLEAKKILPFTITYVVGTLEQFNLGQKLGSDVLGAGSLSNRLHFWAAGLVRSLRDYCMNVCNGVLEL